MFSQLSVILSTGEGVLSHDTLGQEEPPPPSIRNNQTGRTSQEGLNKGDWSGRRARLQGWASECEWEAVLLHTGHSTASGILKLNSMTEKNCSLHHCVCKAM